MIPDSIVPGAVQVVLIVLVTQGLKSLAKALFDKDIAGKAGGIAYVIVGLLVFAVSYTLPLLPPEVAKVIVDVLAVLASLLAGSGLYSAATGLRGKV